MTYLAYSEYKDSGVEWIGDIPASWGMWKIIHTCPYVASGTTPKTDSDLYYGGDNLWITTGELREDIIFDTKKHVTDKALVDMPTLRVHPIGSVAIAMYGATIGRLGILGKEATTNQACCVMPPSKILHNKYLFYWLYATRQEIINLSSGGGQPNVNQEKIASLKVSAPCVNEQKQIATFLDRETQKIDRLIEKQQQLIKLLQEKRQAVISHAVTKGLNPDAKMKDSGVEWLGGIPSHWGVCAVWMGFELGRGRVISNEEIQDNLGGYPVYSSQTENNGEFGCIDTYDFDGDYLTWTTDGANAGTVFERHGRFNCTNVCGTLRPRSNEWDLTFYRHALDVASGWFVRHDINPKLMNNVMSAIRIPKLPRKEQTQIATFLDLEAQKIDRLIAKCNGAIQLSKERRTALISAAVTGKIDVRNTAMDDTNSPITEQGAVAL